MTHALQHSIRANIRAFYSLLFAFCLLPFATHAQEQLGMRLESNAGLYSAALNPANAAFSPNRWEISLFSADFFAENSYAFLRNTSLPHALANTDQIILADNLSPDRPAPANAIAADFFDRNRKMHAVGQARLSGPGALFRLDEWQSLGFTTAVRAMTSAYRVPSALRYSALQDLPLDQTVTVKPFGAAAMAWGEIGGYYGRRGETVGGLRTAFGVSPKLLLGLEGGYARAREAFSYTPVQGDATAFANNVSWDYALTTGHLDQEQNRPRINGLGAGLDVGFTWASPADRSDTEEDYQWRAGIALIDLGFVRFGRHAERHWLRLDTSATVSPADFPGQTALEGYLPDLSSAFLGDSARTYQDDHFTVGLPTALSLQFDYRLAPNWYASAVLVQPAPLLKHSLRRAATLAVVPRFEQRWVSVSLPLVLDDWRSPRVGLAARLGMLYLGTDNLGSFFRQKRLTGGDFYVGLKINAFTLGGGEGWGGRGQKRGRIKCYDF